MRSSRCPQGAYLNLKTKTIQLIWVSGGQGITRWCLSYCQVNSKEREKMWLDISKAFATEGLVGSFPRRPCLSWDTCRLKGNGGWNTQGIGKSASNSVRWSLHFKNGSRKVCCRRERQWSWDLSTNVWLTINIPGGGGEPGTMMYRFGNRRWGLSTCEGKDLADDLWLYSQLSSGYSGPQERSWWTSRIPTQ